MEKKRATFRRSIRRFDDGQISKRLADTLIAEEPFTVVWQSLDGHSERLASTMRTPGDDLALAAGMLFSEGVLSFKEELNVMSFCAGGGVNELNRLKAELRLNRKDIENRLRHKPSQSTPQSACGMCGLDDLSAPSILVNWAKQRYDGKPFLPSDKLLKDSVSVLDHDCPLFKRTGASHACLIVDHTGKAVSLAEDVGRHNACDKAVGRLFLASSERFQLPPRSGMIFSSRLSFELAAKAVAAGASWIASVGAPTHLAAVLAETCGLPLFGFLSTERHNLYTSVEL